MPKKANAQALGDYIFKLRESVNPNRKAFATKIGLDASTVLHIENGDTENPGLYSILAIADGLKTNPMQLIAVYLGESPNKYEQDNLKNKEVRKLLAEMIANAPEWLILEALMEKRGRSKMRELLEQVELEGK